MRKAIISLIIISGIFIFKGIESPAYFSQSALFMLTGFLLAGYLVYKENKFLGYMAWLFGLSIFRSYLFGRAPDECIFKEALYGASIFAVYYSVKKLKLKEDILKYFLIPIGLNALLVLIQVFDNNSIPMLPRDSLSGFLGNSGLAGCYLAMGIPICLKYYKRWVFPLVLVIILTRSITGCLAALVVMMFYFYHSNKKLWRMGCLIIVITMLLFCINSVVFEQGIITIREDMMQRACMWTGALDGARHHIITGWGVGSFAHTMKKIPEEDSYYLGRAFNSKDYRLDEYGNYKNKDKLYSYMSHPHNEVILNIWNSGILFLIIFIGLFLDLKRKFTVKLLFPFSILVCGFILMMGHFLSSPVWLMLMFSLGIYDRRAICQKVKK